jgi:Flp pilus assembly protein TadD/peroxiredoxin
MDSRFFSRRRFLNKLRWAPTVVLPTPFSFSGLYPWLFPPRSHNPAFSLTDHHFTPHYPSRSPLEDVLNYVVPGLDTFKTELFAAEIAIPLNRWSTALKNSIPSIDTLTAYLAASLGFNELLAASRSAATITNAPQLQKLLPAEALESGRDQFIEKITAYFASLAKLHTAEFEIKHLQQSSKDPLRIETEVGYAFIGQRANGHWEERLGTWKLDWSKNSAGAWLVDHWLFTGESRATIAAPIFQDVTAATLGTIESYQRQLLLGVDHWRTVLDGACGIDVYGNHGIAAGDFDGDGFDDLYICQPSGLPNRLYRNLGDGTFEDATERSGLGILDATACAIFADFENRGRQDLLVVCASGPLLFLNQGNGGFQLKRDAFSFAQPPQGTFTHAAVADYDRDGRLDIYFCLYSYYLGLDQYHYPSPYFDARNGPPNFLFHNEGNAKFIDRTAYSGLNVENDRFSFSCAWGDLDSNGWPDLYVANDFGRSNLYRNRGDGTFEAISDAAAVNDPGAGMSACWCDFDNDGKQDVYVANMWSAAGQRISEQEIFHQKDPQEIQSLYRRHSRGNSLYKNSGNAHFQNISAPAGVEMGRWAWSSDFWDFDHDGYSDLYIANGYISGGAAPDLGSFFWRQVVGNSPSSSTPSLAYERGWNAINELIRSDFAWAGFERNTLYLNNRDGSFTEISGIAGMDFLDDSRAFALADLDHDGRLEVILKNRNGPQVRILHNTLTEIGDSISFGLRGTKSNRDAIGASVTVQSGALRQTKYLQSGTGFLSQHSKELFFGLGKAQPKVVATIHWPSGLIQSFESLPVNHRISIEEGKPTFLATRFDRVPSPTTQQLLPANLNRLPASSQTWLLDPLPAPDFTLSSLTGNAISLHALRGETILLNFWSQDSLECLEQLISLQSLHADSRARSLQILCINVDDPPDAATLSAFAAQHRLTLPVLRATPEVAGIYNILYRFLFDRRRDLPLPCSFLVDQNSTIVKIYQGPFDSKQLWLDSSSIPKTDSDRTSKALPFPGTLHNGSFQRNDFTYGVALFQRGYLDPAAASFKQVVAAKPDDPEAYYNLGTLYLRKNDLAEAEQFLQQTVKLRPDYPEAWNNLGMIAGQQNRADEAIRNFKQSIFLRPDYTVALVNLGNVYRRQGNLADASALFNKALALEPENPEANYSLGMLFARQNDSARAIELLQKAAATRPDYPDAWNNLGVLLVRQGQNSAAEEKFKRCIEVAPNFDQAYLNLAQLYAIANEKEKARAVLESLLHLQPQHKLAQQALEMLN